MNLEQIETKKQIEKVNNKTMKKLFALVALVGMFSFGFDNIALADGTDTTKNTPAATTTQPKTSKSNTTAASSNEPAPASVSITQQVKQYFIDGGPQFMALVFLVFLLGLALSIERIIYLNMSTTNTTKLLANIEDALASGGIEAAKDVCRNTRGPVASIFYQGLDRSSEGVEMVEKAVINYGSVQAGVLEKNLSWISLFIATAPMLGFLGTVIGIIEVFTIIEETGQTEPVQIAGAMKVALNTTLAGLVAAIVLQIFYNYIVSKIDGLVNEMEDASISLVDLVVKHNLSK